ncbi:GNAT family N-acetyltransferase [Streptomyces sp. NPDC055400]
MASVMALISAASASIRATSARRAATWLSVRLKFAHAGWQREWYGVWLPPSRARSRSGVAQGGERVEVAGEERFRVFPDLEAGIGNQRAQLAFAQVGPGISVGELGLRCRVLSFLNTPYFDDVRQTRPEISAPGFELVATDDSGTVLGAMDVTVDSDLATIDTVAVHPDHQHQGHGRALLAEAQTRARALSLNTLDAWTSLTACAGIEAWDSPRATTTCTSTPTTTPSPGNRTEP